jgi:hypothetical protein
MESFFEQLQHEITNLDTDEDLDLRDGPDLGEDGIDDFPDDDDEEEPDEEIPCASNHEDELDPFYCPEVFMSEDSHLLDHPPHITAIHAVVSWLHLQFHLPRIACNALLTIFSIILLSISTSIMTPFVTLQSSNNVLGIDKPIHTLPVCPSCREVFPPATSHHSQEVCMPCNTNLWLHSRTSQGNTRSVKSLVVNFPYLPLSEQIKSLLKIPGLESVLDDLPVKPRKPGEYIDIFDGAMCCTKLKGPNSNLFFSNTSHESKGPNGELRLGVNLGIDW